MSISFLLGPRHCNCWRQGSGTPLTQEMRQMGIPVVNFTPLGVMIRITRVHSVSPLFEAGMVWYPDTAFGQKNWLKKSRLSPTGSMTI